jgi:hypothetical protein
LEIGKDDGRLQAEGGKEHVEHKALPCKSRTSKPSSRQKTNRLFLDQHPVCVCGSGATELYHDVRRGHPLRYDERFIRALCPPCHVAVHKPAAASA